MSFIFADRYSNIAEIRCTPDFHVCTQTGEILTKCFVTLRVDRGARFAYNGNEDVNFDPSCGTVLGK